MIRASSLCWNRETILSPDVDGRFAVQNVTMCISRTYVESNRMHIMLYIR